MQRERGRTKRAHHRVRSVIGALRTVLLAILIALVAPLIACNAAIDGQTIWVSFDGNDANDGSAAAPLASWQRAVDRAQPGDTILLQPGVYKVSGHHESAVEITNDGRQDAPITIMGDGGLAVLDCSGLDNSRVAYCLRLAGDWWRVSNIATTGARQRSKRAWTVGLLVENASYNVLDGVQSFRNQGPGIMITGRSKSNVLRNCRAYENYDPMSKVPGGNADGIAVSTIPREATGNVITRCHAYRNSDDGFDLWKAEAIVTISNSVAYGNGYVPASSTPAGDGDGFKLGENQSGPAHEIVGNRAFENRGYGFNRNNAARPSNLVGNRSYANTAGNWNWQ